MIFDVTTVQIGVVLATIVVGVFFYTTEKVSLELTSLFIVSFLLIFFHLVPVTGQDGRNVLGARALLAGFADPALIAVLALLVVGQGLIQTGALEKPAQVLVRAGGRSPTFAIVISLLAVTLLSGFLNNTPVVVILIPILSAIAERFDRPASSVMMPLSYVAILGGMTTLIGSSTNLLVAGALEGLGMPRIGFFDFTIPGLVLAGVGFIYCIFVVPRLIPDRGSLAGSLVGATGRHFLAEIDVKEGSPLVGMTSVGGFFPNLPEVTVRIIQRKETTILPPFEDVEIKEGDALIVAATRKSLTKLLSDIPGLIAPSLPQEEDAEEAESSKPAGDQTVAELVVAPASRYEGRTLRQIGFHDQTGCTVLGIQRRARMYRASINEIRLEAGDTLLVVGRRVDVLNLRTDKDVLLLEWSAAELPRVAHAGQALTIFAFVVALAGLNILPIVVTAVSGAAMMILSGCLNIRQAVRSLDRRVMLIVGAAIAMGGALQETGGAALLANLMVESLHGAGVPIILSALFLLVAVVTNVLSNNATAVLFTPIAVGIAKTLECDPMIFVYAVIFAANCSFATPMGYQTNLLVMGPGNYRFGDYLRSGAALLVIVWLTFSLFAPWYYDL